MAQLIQWDAVGEKIYETGVDHGVLYVQDVSGTYPKGVAWNGLVSVTESPSGAEPNPQFADNIKYLNLLSAEEFGGTIEAFTYPDEFGVCDGLGSAGLLASLGGVSIGQQLRKPFGLVYRTILGNDSAGQAYGYKLHLLYGCLVSPSEKAYQTINESPEAITFSWDFTTTPAAVTGFKPTAMIVIDSTKVLAADLLALETILYGVAPATEGILPTPDAVIAMFDGA